MSLMLVTLDVSKLSGWLNAAAFCQVAPRHVKGDTGGAWEVRGRVGAVWRCMQRARRNRLGTGRGTRAGVAHLKHAGHARDAGCVKAQRLVERSRVLPSRTEAHGGRHGGWEARGRVRVVWRCTQRARRNRLDTGATARARGAHIKHAGHGRDAGRVEAQQLVERSRALPSHTEAHGGRHGGLGGARARGSGGRARRACTEEPTGHRAPQALASGGGCARKTSISWS